MFGDSRAAVISNLGKPKKLRTDKDLSKASELTAEDRRLIQGHFAGPNENEITELAYDGLAMKILKVKSPPYREFIYLIEITSKKYRMSWNLDVGCQRKEVRRILGNPSRSDDGYDSYVVVHFDDNGNPIGYEDQVTFRYHSNTVSRICFWSYID
jgi:hypothetical protein